MSLSHEKVRAVNLPTELLRNFTLIVDAGSMLRAVDRALVSQSALSLQMKRLEDLVQTPLFARKGRRLGLTPAGENMLMHAREILAANDRAVQALREIGGFDSTRLESRD